MEGGDPLVRKERHSTISFSRDTRNISVNQSFSPWYQKWLQKNDTVIAPVPLQRHSRRWPLDTQESGWVTLYNHHLILDLVSTVTIVLRVSERIPTIPFTCFFEDELTEVHEILFIRMTQNMSVFQCPRSTWCTTSEQFKTHCLTWNSVITRFLKVSTVRGDTIPLVVAGPCVTSGMDTKRGAVKTLWFTFMCDYVSHLPIELNSLSFSLLSPQWCTTTCFDVCLICTLLSDQGTPTINWRTELVSYKWAHGKRSWFHFCDGLYSFDHRKIESLNRSLVWPTDDWVTPKTCQFNLQKQDICTLVLTTSFFGS